MHYKDNAEVSNEKIAFKCHLKEARALRLSVFSLSSWQYCQQQPLTMIMAFPSCELIASSSSCSLSSFDLYLSKEYGYTTIYHINKRLHKDNINQLYLFDTKTVQVYTQGKVDMQMKAITINLLKVNMQYVLVPAPSKSSELYHVLELSLDYHALLPGITTYCTLHYSMLHPLKLTIQNSDETKTFSDILNLHTEVWWKCQTQQQ